MQNDRSVRGVAESGFERLEAAFRELAAGFEAGGGAVCVLLDGKPVVGPIFSSTKGFTHTAGVLGIPEPNSILSWDGAGWIESPMYFGPVLSAFGQGGAGGQSAFCDRENDIGFALVRSRLEAETWGGSASSIDALYSSDAVEAATRG